MAFFSGNKLEKLKSRNKGWIEGRSLLCKLVWYWDEYHVIISFMCDFFFNLSIFLTQWIKTKGFSKLKPQIISTWLCDEPIIEGFPLLSVFISIVPSRNHLWRPKNNACFCYQCTCTMCLKNATISIDHYSWTVLSINMALFHKKLRLIISLISMGFCHCNQS